MKVIVQPYVRIEAEKTFYEVLVTREIEGSGSKTLMIGSTENRPIEDMLLGLRGYFQELKELGEINRFIVVRTGTLKNKDQDGVYDKLTDKDYGKVIGVVMEYSK